jgi:F-type H+-transporting ATPase subunit b
MVREKIESAEEKQRQAEEKLKQVEERLAGLEAEISDLRTRAIKEASEIKDEIIREAKQDAENIITRAQEKAEVESRKIYNQLKEQVIDLTFHIVKLVLKREVKREDHYRYIKENIEEFKI